MTGSWRRALGIVSLASALNAGFAGARRGALAGSVGAATSGAPWSGPASRERDGGVTLAGSSTVTAGLAIETGGEAGCSATGGGPSRPRRRRARRTAGRFQPSRRAARAGLRSGRSTRASRRSCLSVGPRAARMHPARRVPTAREGRAPLRSGSWPGSSPARGPRGGPAERSRRRGRPNRSSGRPCRGATRALSRPRWTRLGLAGPPGMAGRIVGAAGRGCRPPASVRNAVGRKRERVSRRSCRVRGFCSCEAHPPVSSARRAGSAAGISRHQDDGDRAPLIGLRELGADALAAARSHPGIDEHEVGLDLVECLEGGAAVRADVHVDADRFKDLQENANVLGVAVDDQDLRLGWFHGSRREKKDTPDRANLGSARRGGNPAGSGEGGYRGRPAAPARFSCRADTVVWIPPRTRKSPSTVIFLGWRALTRSSRIRLVTASWKAPSLR